VGVLTLSSGLLRALSGGHQPRSQRPWGSEAVVHPTAQPVQVAWLGCWREPPEGGVVHQQLPASSPRRLPGVHSGLCEQRGAVGAGWEG